MQIHDSIPAIVRETAVGVAGTVFGIWFMTWAPTVFYVVATLTTIGTFSFALHRYMVWRSANKTALDEVSND